MINTNARGTTMLSAVAMAVVLGACSDEHDAQARAAEGIVVAAATDAATRVEPVSTPVDSSPIAPETPRFTNVSYGAAADVFRKGRYEESADMFAVYATENPEDAAGHYMHGLSAWKSGDHATAESALRRAVELSGETVKIRTNLGRVLLERGRAAEALPHLEKAVELEPTEHEVWRVLGNVYAQLERSVDAIEAYRQALMLNDHDSWTMNNYGLVLIRQGRFEEALRPLSRAVELAPQSEIFRRNLDVALEAAGELEGGDTTVFAREFVEDMQAWVSEDEHDC